MNNEQEEQTTVPIPEFCPNCGLRETLRTPRMFVCGSVHSKRQIGALIYVSEACDTVKKRNERIVELEAIIDRPSPVLQEVG